MGEAMDRVREIVLFVAAVIAVFAFIAAVYQSVNEKLGSAALCAGMAVAFTLMDFLPKLEIFEAFGVKAHLNKTVNESDTLLEKISDLHWMLEQTAPASAPSVQIAHSQPQPDRLIEIRAIRRADPDGWDANRNLGSSLPSEVGASKRKNGY
jgi:hypothetical protein